MNTQSSSVTYFRKLKLAPEDILHLNLDGSYVVQTVDSFQEAVHGLEHITDLNEFKNMIKARNTFAENVKKDWKSESNLQYNDEFCKAVNEFQAALQKVDYRLSKAIYMMYQYNKLLESNFRLAKSSVGKLRAKI